MSSSIETTINPLASLPAAPVLDPGLYAWMQERGIAPESHDGQIEMIEVVEALNEHERQLLASTPAAPGIDLEQFRELEGKCQRIQENRDFWHGVAEKLREELFEAREEQAKRIDASPKGGSAAFQVPPGWALVPDRMQLTPENMELLADTLRGADDNEQWCGGVLWVGWTTDDDGEPTHYGLSVGNVECLEEGSINIVEFNDPQATSAEVRP